MYRVLAGQDKIDVDGVTVILIPNAQQLRLPRDSPEVSARPGHAPAKQLPPPDG